MGGLAVLRDKPFDESSLLFETFCSVFVMVKNSFSSETAHSYRAWLVRHELTQLTCSQPDYASIVVRNHELLFAMCVMVRYHGPPGDMMELLWSRMGYASVNHH